MRPQTYRHGHGLLGSSAARSFDQQYAGGSARITGPASFPQRLGRGSFLRATARRAEMSDRRVRGKVLAFWGAKGGSGVTTLAANFALALKHETKGDVALIDLNPHLGDVAILLGLTPRFTVAEALANPERLDKEFVSTLMTADRSGVAVLAAPDTYNSLHAQVSSVSKLLDLVAVQYSYVVVDAGPSLGEAAALLKTSIDMLNYLVTQADALPAKQPAFCVPI